jgi:hypothetical protein
MLETVTVINVYGEKVNTCLGYLGQYNTNKYGSTCVPNLICWAYKSDLVAQQSGTKITTMIAMILSHFIVLLKLDLDAANPWRVSWTYESNQNHNNDWCYFGHTLLCRLSWIQMFNKPMYGCCKWVSWTSKSDLSSAPKWDQNHNNDCDDYGHTLLFDLSQT